MKRLTIIMMVLVGGIVLTTVAVAQDVAAVKAAVVEHYAAVKAGDMAAVAEQHTPDFSAFFNDGGLLWPYASREEQRNSFQTLYDAGLRLDWQVRHLDVTVYGNAAVAAFYLVGSVTWPGEITRQGTWRVSEVWIKEAGQWKEAHHHDSPLVPAPPQ